MKAVLAFLLASLVTTACSLNRESQSLGSGTSRGDSWRLDENLDSRREFDKERRSQDARSDGDRQSNRRYLDIDEQESQLRIAEARRRLRERNAAVRSEKTVQIQISGKRNDMRTGHRIERQQERAMRHRVSDLQRDAMGRRNSRQHEDRHMSNERREAQPDQDREGDSRQERRTVRQNADSDTREVKRVSSHRNDERKVEQRDTRDLKRERDSREERDLTRQITDEDTREVRRVLSHRNDERRVERRETRDLKRDSESREERRKARQITSAENRYHSPMGARGHLRTDSGQARVDRTLETEQITEQGEERSEELGITIRRTDLREYQAVSEKRKDGNNHHQSRQDLAQESDFGQERRRTDLTIDAEERAVRRNDDSWSEQRVDSRSTRRVERIDEDRELPVERISRQLYDQERRYQSDQTEKTDSPFYK